MSNQITTNNELNTSMMSMIENLSLNPNVDAEKLQKLLDVQLQVMDRQAKYDYYSAMNNIQAQLPSFAKLDKGHKSNFVKLEKILDELNPLLKENGFSLSFSQLDCDRSGAIKVGGTLSHISGHSETYSAEMELDTQGAKSGPQKSGSTYSHARRYLTCMIFNINTYDDDDGNGGTLTLISKIEYDEIKKLILSLEEINVPVDIEKFCKHYGISDLEEMPKSKFNQAVMALQTKLKRAMTAKEGENNG